MGKIKLVIIIVALFSFLETITRFFWPAQSTTIIGLQKPQPSAKQFIQTREMPNQDLYIETPTGLRLKPNVNAIIRNHHLAKTDIELSTNSLGYRAEELGAKAQDEVRILVLGDSITLADYVQYEQTYTYYMEKYLNEHTNKVDNDTGRRTRRYRVVNAGVGSIGLDTELAVLLETGLSVKPDMAILALYLNDASDSPYIKVVKPPSIFRQSHLLIYLFTWINSLSVPKSDRFSRLLAQNSENQAARKEFSQTHEIKETDWKTDPAGFNALIVKNFPDWGFAWSPKYWEKVKQNITIMQEIAQNNHFKLAVVLFPVRYQIEAEHYPNEPQERFEELMTVMNIPHLDLLKSLRTNYRDKTSDLYFDHCHYKLEGNQIIGREISRFLLSSSTSYVLSPSPE